MVAGGGVGGGASGEDECDGRHGAESEAAGDETGERGNKAAGERRGQGVL